MPNKRFVFLTCLIVSSATVLSAATLTIAPPVVYDCLSGLAAVTLTWSGASGPVEVLVGKPNGTALTGLLGASGSTTTGNWVVDGMTFYLVDQAGVTEASAVAHVSCGATPQTINTGLANGSYFPLAVGNRWIYKYNDRTITSDYLVFTITGTQTVGSMTYFVLTQTSPPPTATLALLRGDDNGVIWQSTSTGDQVYVDPNAPGTQQVGYSGALGTFTNAIMPPNQVVDGVIATSSIYVRGIGLVSSQSNLLTGSSGGFSSGFDLVDVQMDGIHLSVPAPTLSLSIENTTFDLTDKLAPNCAVPCYFVACNLVPGTDPTGTYRPCAQTRVATAGAPAGATTSLQLLSPSGTSVFSAQVTSGLDYIRLPLYTASTNSQNFTLLPPGDYQLSAAIIDAGATLATSNMTVHIQ
jgi:hypothetical protein